MLKLQHYRSPPTDQVSNVVIHEAVWVEFCHILNLHTSQPATFANDFSLSPTSHENSYVTLSREVSFKMHRDMWEDSTLGADGTNYGQRN